MDTQFLQLLNGKVRVDGHSPPSERLVPISERLSLKNVVLGLTGAVSLLYC